MTLPYLDSLIARDPGPRAIPEPLRPGEPGGPPCRVCPVTETMQTIWSDGDWILNHGVDTSLPGAVWLATRVHVDSFADLPPALAAAFGPLAGRIEQAILTLGDIGRVHLYRWGDGGAHFHVWFLPRPLGMLAAKGPLLPLWEDVLPRVDEAAIAAARARIGAALGAGSDSPGQTRAG